MLQEGHKLPLVTFKTRVKVQDVVEGSCGRDGFDGFEFRDVSTEQLFAGKQVVIFSVPGAFTPCCSKSHAPGYQHLYDEFKAQGVDEVYCLSVNDCFVMNAWFDNLGFEKDTTVGTPFGFTKVKPLADGAADFTQKIGMGCNWSTERGFGTRSWRHSMIVTDGVVSKLFVEPNFIQNSGPDPFECSDAWTMLKYLTNLNTAGQEPAVGL